MTCHGMLNMCTETLVWVTVLYQMWQLALSVTRGTAALTLTVIPTEPIGSLIYLWRFYVYQYLHQYTQIESCQIRMNIRNVMH